MRAFKKYSTLIQIAILAIATNNFDLIKCDKLSSKNVKTSIKSVDVQKTKIYGPGLEPHKVVLPVRYFFIQPVDGHRKPLVNKVFIQK